MVLSTRDVWLFRHVGFTVAPGRLPDDLVDRLNRVTGRHVAEQIEPIQWATNVHDPGTRQVDRLRNLLARDPVYVEAATHPVVLGPLQDLLGPNVELLTNKHNHLLVRQAGSPPVVWHRGEPLYAPLLVTALVYLGESTTHNGCVRVVPGSHLDPTMPADYRIEPAERRRPFQEVDFYRQSLPVPMPRGGVLLFNDALYHGSDVNWSDEDRRSMTLGYMASAAEDLDSILVCGERQARARRGGAPPAAAM
jgi:ectoine hydroxylase-related dioxygenase (phytanoyl-CoA dioxygenase family)